MLTRYWQNVKSRPSERKDLLTDRVSHHNSNLVDLTPPSSLAAGSSV